MNDAAVAVMPQANVVQKPVGKTRNPWVVLILGIVTLGIYTIVWHYCVLEELRNWRGQGWSGIVFIIFALFFGIALIAVPWLIPAYIGRMYQEDGREKPITGLSGFWVLLPLIGGIIWLVKVQNHMNSFWESKR
ncbi:hypothetical protein DSCO28_34360 [Desulfosarcina ovata subsp. sediminis]|uniref:DUF4234 domain-containing protein n=1 Tax=Desulfosarcina ovata subsp. sediminis TaxID=885957 RepID=A0A5K7ZR72_9BACT|nr:DUF4234 domain-containing protein [Desulfosarcina ovata]BBO82870.1 hypothetical protein DSCO28_34360 [Desulfosarcina ovata subsp. sediminis]